MARRERSAGVVIFRGAAAARRYLLLDYGGHWDFPKGHLKDKETDPQAALREVAEETGIKLAALLGGFAHEIRYFFRTSREGLVDKTVIYFLAKSSADIVTLSDEHVGFEFLGFAEAMKRLTFANARAILRLSEEFLTARKD